MTDVLSAGSPDRFGYEWHRYAEMRPNTRSSSAIGRCISAPKTGAANSFSYCRLRHRSQQLLADDVLRRWRQGYRCRRRLAGGGAAQPGALPGVSVEKQSAYEIGESDAYDIVFSIGSFIICNFRTRHSADGACREAGRPCADLGVWLREQRVDRAVFRPAATRAVQPAADRLVHHLSLYRRWAVDRAAARHGRIGYFELLRRLAFPHMRSIVFDQMLPKIAHYWPRATVEACSATPAGRHKGQLGQ